MNDAHQFTEWFVRATGNEPYPFQIRFAHGDQLPEPCRRVRSSRHGG